MNPFLVKPEDQKEESKKHYKRLDRDPEEVKKVQGSKFKDLSKEELLGREELVEVDKTRTPASLVFIGHVDSGKSTICGNLMLLTGMID